MKHLITTLALFLVIGNLNANNYKVDASGMHASINFKISHLGYSWIVGRFDSFDGEFSFDPENPNSASVSINVDTKSINTNHADRDKHLRSDDFLNVEKHPQASFKSTAFEMSSDTQGVLTGILNLHGTDKEIKVDVTKIGEGKDPWGGYRAGFEGTTTITMADFGIEKYKGTASGSLELHIVLEGKKVQ